MFDVSIWEIGVVLIVALLVVGPTRLPTVARTVGRWLGHARNVWANLKKDVEKSLGTDDESSHG